MIEKLAALVKDKGPLTGQDLVHETKIDILTAWRSCSNAGNFLTRIVGKRYLRLDQKVEGYARLSPSIMREFLNYTVIGLHSQAKEVDLMAQRFLDQFALISEKKISLARDTIARLVMNHPWQTDLLNNAVFIIAGDVVFGMAHTEPRPESSTGELVRGSDLDIIVVTDSLPDDLVEDLDKLIYREKYNLLVNPASKEEIDYIIKDLAVVREQLRFADFKAMVAAKILNEGLFLFGSASLFKRIKEMLALHDIPTRIKKLEERARHERIEAEKCLLTACDSDDQDQLMALFYTSEEKEEIF